MIIIGYFIRIKYIIYYYFKYMRTHTVSTNKMFRINNKSYLKMVFIAAWQYKL